MTAPRSTTAPAHDLDDERRIEAYRIRRIARADRGLDRLTEHHPAGGDPISLRRPDGHIDSAAIAIESTLRNRAGLNSYIAELDLPPKFRDPGPWTYCTDDGCTLCPDAYRNGLLDADSTGTPLLTRIRRRITRAIDFVLVLALTAVIQTVEEIERGKLFRWSRK